MRIIWEQLGPREVRALRTAPGAYDSLSSKTMDPVHDWCEENKIAVRMSFDTFRFRSEADKFIFLLRWS